MPSTNPLLHTLHATSIDEIGTEFDAFNRTWGIVPHTYAAQFDADWSAIRRTATKKGLGRADELITRQKELLEALTGQSKLSEIKTTPVAEELHRYRNTIITAVASGAAMSNGPVAGVFTSSYSGLKARTRESSRPLRHDETALLRVLAATSVATDPGDQPAATYALLDAGQLVPETTLTTLDDIDDAPTMVYAAGNRIGVTDRILPLDTFGSAVLARAAQAARATKQTQLAYRPRKNAPGSNAAACSIHGTVARFLDRVQLNHHDVSAGSITAWRVATTWHTQGAKQAMQVAGLRDPGRTARLAGIPTNSHHTTEPEPVVRMF